MTDENSPDTAFSNSDESETSVHPDTNPYWGV